MTYTRPTITPGITRANYDFFKNLFDGIDEKISREEANSTYAPTVRRLEPAWLAYGDSIAKPTRPGVVAIGDSITDNNHTATTWNGSSYSRTSAYRADGYLTRAMILARQRFSWFDVGISGQVSSQMLARFDTDVTPLKPHIVIEASGTNDMRSGLTVEVMIANRLAMWEKAYAFGAKVIATTVPPAADSNTAVRNNVQKANAWLREYARANPQNFALVDWYPDFVDPLTGGVKASVMDAAGVHPNSLGALIVASKFVAALNRFVPPTFDSLPSDNVNDLANLMSLPLLTGTTGGKTGNYTGVNATGWYGSTSSTTAVGSKVARLDGLGEWQQVVVTGPGSTRLSRDIRTEWAVGDVLQAAVEFETDAEGWADGAVDFQLSCFATGGVTNLMLATSLGLGQDTVVLGRPESGVLQTPPIVVPANTISVQASMLKVNAGTVRFGRVSVRKLA